MPPSNKRNSIRTSSGKGSRSYDPAITQHLSQRHEILCPHKNMCMMFIVAFSIITKNWKMSNNRWIVKQTGAPIQGSTTQQWKGMNYLHVQQSVSFSNTLCWVNKINLKVSQTVWFHLYHILEIIKWRADWHLRVVQWGWGHYKGLAQGDLCGLHPAMVVCTQMYTWGINIAKKGMLLDSAVNANFMVIIM